MTIETVPRLARWGESLILLGAVGESESQQAHVTGAQVGRVDLLIVDHYGLGDNFERQARSWAGRIAAIDDFPGRTHAVDVLIDHTLGHSARDYHHAAPGAQVLAGASYAMIRPQFAALRETSLVWRAARAGRVENVLVAFGATDPHNCTGAAVDILSQISDLNVDVLLGAGHPAAACMKSAAKASGMRVRIFEAREEVAELMTTADVAVGAGGGMTWERCTLGIPTVLVVIAENQRSVAASLRKAGAAIDIGEGPGAIRRRLVEALTTLRRSPRTVEAMSEAAARVCDGLGAQRVAAALLRSLATVPSRS
jgi:UDP-2,4-diacetamido-2,4,6-trideoxy-beta-L-altropyranose hydrolase